MRSAARSRVPVHLVRVACIGPLAVGLYGKLLGRSIFVVRSQYRCALPVWRLKLL
jgi:hypothetical protein